MWGPQMKKREKKRTNQRGGGGGGGVRRKTTTTTTTKKKKKKKKKRKSKLGERHSNWGRDERKRHLLENRRYTFVHFIGNLIVR
ncbi:hypothetical protein WH47_12793 [Habropoda laboriosa]|uniref:Uncharacterized protein n=1 Tax=Habropoda laboriosa TaxID=597456 RepID=A0A0L7R595_9HYME|nr:hypothetical protein WH47_12793 [Habropoda laboriosa]